jgi:hypothetical protein
MCSTDECEPAATNEVCALCVFPLAPTTPSFDRGGRGLVVTVHFGSGQFRVTGGHRHDA